LGAHNFGDQENSWGYRERQLSAAQANVGRSLLGQLDQINEHRKRNAVILLEMLSKTSPLQAPTLPLGSDPAYLRLPLLATDKRRRDSLHSAFWRAGIGAGKMYGRTLGEIFPELAHFATPGALELAARLLTLPTHHFMSERDFERIAAIIREHDMT
jgi:dTDP-4-amino-4,6-dideoxygalactose transaminase